MELSFGRLYVCGRRGKSLSFVIIFHPCLKPLKLFARVAGGYNMLNIARCYQPPFYCRKRWFLLSVVFPSHIGHSKIFNAFGHDMDRFYRSLQFCRPEFVNEAISEFTTDLSLFTEQG